VSSVIASRIGPKALFDSHHGAQEILHMNFGSFGKFLVQLIQDPVGVTLQIGTAFGDDPRDPMIDIADREGGKFDQMLKAKRLGGSFELLVHEVPQGLFPILASWPPQGSPHFYL
jgi:hypothetical protein